METSESRTTAPGFRRTGDFKFQTETRACQEHGAYLAMLTPAGWSTCIACAPDPIAAEVARVERASSQDVAMRKAGIPARFVNRRLATFDAHNDRAALALRVAQSYAGDFGKVRETGQSLIFAGDVGTGKTHLAIGIAHQVMAGGYTARYAVLLDVVRAVKETYSKDSKVSEGAVIERFVKPDLLIVDEVGVQNGSETEKMILFSIVNGRYNELRPTIIISNLALDNLKTYLTDRVMDRMREGSGRFIAFDWDSYRRSV